MTASDQEIRDTLRQMLADWNAATDEQRASALAAAERAATAAELRLQAAAAERAAADSFERSDTDGFVSQWASSLTARLKRTQADLAEAGGVSSFRALFDTDGNLVAAKWVETRFGYAWGLLPTDDPRGRFTGWFHPSEARSAARRKAADARKGYQVGRVLAPAKAELKGTGTGMAGATSVQVVVRRTDGGFSRDAEIVTAADYEEDR
jgi:hypothetical protein